MGDFEVAEVAGAGGVDAALDDLFADKGLLLFKEERVGGYGDAADVEGVLAVCWPGVADCEGETLLVKVVLSVTRRW